MNDPIPPGQMSPQMSPKTSPVLALTHTALHKIKVHAMEEYPEECCGILVGTAGETGIASSTTSTPIRSTWLS